MRLPTHPAERLISVVEQGLKTCFGPPRPNRPSPARDIDDVELSETERRESIALMRVNHAGEVAAQALYAGQALVAGAPDTREHLETAALEEFDHLAWCHARLDELGGRRSWLVPLWFAGGVTVGLAAAATGDRNSFGFVLETEKQVEAHLDDHLSRLSDRDAKSRSILEQMQQDEIRHGQDASAAGANPLPRPARRLMRFGGEVLRRVARIL